MQGRVRFSERPRAQQAALVAGVAVSLGLGFVLRAWLYSRLATYGYTFD